MTKFMHRFILLLFTLVLPLHALAEPADDKLMGKVHLKANMKLDAQARKDIAAAAARIKKSKVGAVKLKGSYLSAKNADEYFSKSIFMARAVEQYLKTLLPSRQQIFTMTSPFSPEKTGRQNFVEILLYPHELTVDRVEGFKINTLEGSDSGTAPAAKAPAAEAPAAEVGPDTAASGGSLSKQADEEKSVTPVRTAPDQSAEDAILANELVRKAKERAAEKARHKDDAD